MDLKEHIATLCAAGTVGIAATGFALGTDDIASFVPRPGKRKRPGSLANITPVHPYTPPIPRRTVSQPASTVLSHREKTPSLSSSLFRRRTVKDPDRDDTTHSDKTPESRGSSRSRHGMLRPWTADTRGSSERRDISSGSSWLKRMSTVSSYYDASPNSSVVQSDTTSDHPPVAVSLPRPANFDVPMPNKLVKRSTSHRALSHDQAQVIYFKRPATTHQRSQTLQKFSPGPRRIEESSSADMNHVEAMQDGNITVHVWRPFFATGYPRKRNTSRPYRDVQSVRTVSASSGRIPTLVLGTHIESTELMDDQGRNESILPPPSDTTIPNGRQRGRRSLGTLRKGQRRRNFTDPTVQITHTAVNGTISSALKQSPISPVSNVSTFDVELPRGTPVFRSSPNMLATENSFALRKRDSAAPSDPTTISSDNDINVFSDDESIDYRSDTAYDSIATRATASSHSGLRINSLGTFFNGLSSAEGSENDRALEKLMQRATIHDQEVHSDQDQSMVTSKGIRKSYTLSETEEQTNGTNLDVVSTPSRSVSTATEDITATPVPLKRTVGETEPASSPPVASFTGHNANRFPNYSDEMDLDDDHEIDWSPKIDEEDDHIPHRSAQPSIRLPIAFDTYSSPTFTHSNVHFGIPVHDSDSEKRSSIFDWSEPPAFGADSHLGNGPRPKTVHGKQGTDARSRPSGRKPPSQMHLRSQSVPVSRDSQVDDPPQSVSKFGTWGLGQKPVSEEWSDDFEFDDIDEHEVQHTIKQEKLTIGRESTRSVKVPQAIIDRQESVHLQFGQVQEFRHLVDELRRLQTRGIALQLIQSNSKQLWDDAESIINLATINDEEEDGEENDLLPISASPANSDIFEEVVLTRNGLGTTASEDHRKTPAGRRSISSPATPPFGRPRGESLAQAKNFLQTIHQNRAGIDASPQEVKVQYQRKMPFDTQDLRDLVIRSGVITRALKEVVRKAEGVSVSPTKTPPGCRDPPFSTMFDPPDPDDGSPCPSFRKPKLPKSRSANSYLASSIESSERNEFLASLTLSAMVK